MHLTKFSYSTSPLCFFPSLIALSSRSPLVTSLFFLSVAWKFFECFLISAPRSLCIASRSLMGGGGGGGGREGERERRERRERDSKI